MLKIYHNPHCSKSRQGLEIIKKSGEDVEIIDYLKNPPTEEAIRSLLKKLNIPAIELVRKNEKIWKENHKGSDLSEEKIIRILHENPKLIERPIVIKNGKAVIGRPPEIVKTLF